MSKYRSASSELGAATAHSCWRIARSTAGSTSSSNFNANGAQQIVLLYIQGQLDGLPSRRGCASSLLMHPRQRRPTLPRVLYKSQSHLLRQRMLACHKSGGILLVPLPKLLVHSPRKQVAELRKALRVGELSNRLTERLPRTSVSIPFPDTRN